MVGGVGGKGEDDMREAAVERRISQGSGITPLELLVVLGLAGLLLLVGVPWARASLAQLKGDAAAAEVISALGEARGLAVARRHDVKVMVDEAAGSVEVDTGSYHRLASGIRLSGPPRGADGRGIIRFHANGSSDGGLVVLAEDDAAWTVVVDPHGGQSRLARAGRPRRY